MTGICLQATIHVLFALQYLRASLTVPLYYERQIKKDSNATHLLHEYDSKIGIRMWSIVAAQTMLLLIGLTFTVYTTAQWYGSIDDPWDFYLLGKWSIDYDWFSKSKQLLIVAACFNTVSVGAILAGLFLIKQWIKEELQAERRWRCAVDGNFLIYFVLLLLQAFAQIAVTIWISQTDQDEF